MTLSQIISIIKKIALDQPNIHSCVDEFLDLNDVTAKYSAVILQQQTHRRNNDFISFNFYLGYSDRLNEDKSNEIEIQSTGIQVINSIVSKLEDLGFDTTMGSYNVFTERFLALAAGCYTELSITVPVSQCEDDFAEEKLDTTITANGEYNFIPKGLGYQSVHLNVDVAHLQDKSLDITKNGNYKVQYDKGFSGLGKVDVNVNVPDAEIHNQTKEELITINNKRYTYTPDKDYTGIGKLNVMVQIPEQPIYEEGYVVGKEDGINEQKRKLTDINITQNGTYTKEDGYKNVVVNVPVPVINNQEKSITITENGQTDITPDTNYTGLSKVGVNVNIDTQSYYDNGYSQGKIDGKTEGIAEQKAKLTDISITENGTYEKEDGYKSVVVNVPIPEINNQEKSITINSNGTSSVVPDTGYTGISKIDITVNVPTSGGDGIDFSVIGYDAQENTDANTEIQDSIAYSQSLLENYNNNKIYKNDGKIMFVPLFPCDNRTSFSSMFLHCHALTFIPKLNTSSGNKFANMFNNCTALTTIPALDLSNGEDFTSMFYGCTALTNIPLINTGNGEGFTSMFCGCTALTTIPALDLSNGKYFSNMFEGCSSLTTIPELNMSKVLQASYMFAECSSLTTIQKIEISGVKNGGMFEGCSSLTDIEVTGPINYDISFSDCVNLSYNSIKSILTACKNTTDTRPGKTVSFNRTIADQNNELTNLVASCTSKGWTIENLRITTA